MYLGNSIKNNTDCVGEVKSRLAMGMAVMGMLTKIWENKSVSITTKLRLMKAVVWPVATHGCESRTLKKQEERYIQAFENQCMHQETIENSMDYANDYRASLHYGWCRKRTA